MELIIMTPIVLDPHHPGFPPEPAVTSSQCAALRAERVRWLWARLDELAGDCIIGLTLPEDGILEADFPACPGSELVEKLRPRGVFCTVAGEGSGVRFTLSAGQRVEAIDTLQAILMDVLMLS
jgi:hypothetical protein